jgi:hypothetical protein
MRMNFSYINDQIPKVHPTQNIETFDRIRLSKFNPLVLCDIDDTLLTMDTVYQLDPTKPVPLKIEYVPTHTDYHGFNRLVYRVKQMGGELQFLTARDKEFHAFTRSNFDTIGVDYDSFKIHYTNANPKGEYIKKNIDLSKYGEVIFIDDRELFLENVKRHHPQIICYKFVIPDK